MGTGQNGIIDGLKVKIEQSPQFLDKLFHLVNVEVDDDIYVHGCADAAVNCPGHRTNYGIWNGQGL